MPEIPTWIQVFVISGIALLFIVIPLKTWYGMSKNARERLRMMKELADRLKERFEEVRFERGLLRPHRIHLKYEGRPVVLLRRGDKELEARLEPKAVPGCRLVARTRGRVTWPFKMLWGSLTLLRRVRTGDPLIDDPLALYARPTVGAYLCELALAEEKSAGFTESFTVLRHLPGVKRFELRISPSAGFRLRFRLRADDLLYRPEELESAFHHAFKLYDQLAFA